MRVKNIVAPSSSVHARGKQAMRYAVTDGRTALGTVRMDGDSFVAINVAGAEIGRYRTLVEAARALPDGRAP